MHFYLAIDAGGTKTDYLLADEARILASATTGTIKRMQVPLAEASRNLADGLARVSDEAGVPLESVHSTCVGLAGNNVPLNADWLRRELQESLRGEFEIVNDVEIALDAAFPGETGILILAGTGSSVAGRLANGIITTAGGYGPVLSDQGSGYRIGSEALRDLFFAIDREEGTALLEAFLAHWSLDSIDALVAYANTCPSGELSTLAPVVLRCADAGDRVALHVLHREGISLASLALLVHKRLLLAMREAWQPRFALAGSVLQSVPPLREALIAELQREIPPAWFEPASVVPVEGALWRARRASSSLPHRQWCGSEPVVS